MARTRIVPAVGGVGSRSRKGVSPSRNRQTLEKEFESKKSKVRRKPLKSVQVIPERRKEAKAATPGDSVRSESKRLKVSLPVAGARQPTLRAEIGTKGIARVTVALENSAASLARGDTGQFDEVARKLLPHFTVECSGSHFAGEQAGSRRRSAAQEALVGTAALSAGKFRGAASSGRPTEEMQVHCYPKLGVMLGYVDEAGLNALAKSGHVSRIDRAPQISVIKPIRHAACAPPKDMTWGLKRLGVEEMWKRGFTGRGVVIGHLDTGIDSAHPTLRGAVAHFLEIKVDGTRASAGKPRDSGWHGTHTAGTLVGRPVGGRHIGIAPEATLASSMVIEGGDIVARLLTGLEWMLELKVPIVSLSLGLIGNRTEWRPIFRTLRRNNVLPVVAIGNDGRNSSRSPGNFAQSLSVGAIDEGGRTWSFSSRDLIGDRRVPKVLCPGVDVESCVPNGGYAASDGTSMATPHLAGMAALLLQAARDIGGGAVPIAQIESALLASARQERFGRFTSSHGIPHAGRALEALERTLQRKPALSRSSPRKVRS